MKKVIKYIKEKKLIRKFFTYLIILFVWVFLIRSWLNEIMGKIVTRLPSDFFWSYESITPLKTEYKVGDLIKFESKNERRVEMRLIFQDYLYCDSDEGDKYRYLYTSTFSSPKWKIKAAWTFWKTDISDWYKLEETWEGCYILSEQIGFPYWEEIYQSYKSWPFNIVE